MNIDNVAAMLIIGVLSSLGTILIGWWQKRNESNRLGAQNATDFSSAMENYGTSWDILRKALEEEIARLRTQSIAREEELLGRMKSLEEKLIQAKSIITSMEESEKRKFEEMTSRMKTLEDGVEALVQQVRDLREVPVFTLDTKED